MSESDFMTTEVKSNMNYMQAPKIVDSSGLAVCPVNFV